MHEFQTSLTDTRSGRTGGRRPGLDLTEFMVGGSRDRHRPPAVLNGPTSWWA